MKQLFTLTILLSSFCVYAQTDSTQRSTSVVFFGDLPASKSNKSYDGHAIKFGILQVVSGQYGAFYEKEFSDIFGFQGGLGLTGRNFMYGLLNEEIDDESQNFAGPNQEDISDNNYNYDDRKAKIGYYISLMPRFYYNEDGMDGGYIGLNFQYRRYNMLAYGNLPANTDHNSYSYSNDLVSGGSDIDEFENHTIIALAWGKQSTNTKSIIDFYVSGGLRKVKGERRDLGYYENPVNSSDQTFVVTKKDVDQAKLFFEIGLNIGLWWDNTK